MGNPIVYSDDFDAWGEALERAKVENTDWRVPINSPPFISHWKCPEGRLVYCDRWGVLHDVIEG